MSEDLRGGVGRGVGSRFAVPLVGSRRRYEGCAAKADVLRHVFPPSLQEMTVLVVFRGIVGDKRVCTHIESALAVSIWGR